MRPIPRLALAALLLLTLQGCVTVASIPELPESLQVEGLLVAKVYMPGSVRWENSQITIDGRLYNASLRDGYIAIALPPGEHNFKNLRTQGWSETVSGAESPYRHVARYSAPVYVPTYTTVYYTLLPIERSFTIEAGRVTNLGLLVFLTDPKDKKKFYTITLDNSREMGYYLEANYPKLMATLKQRDVALAPGKYLEADKLTLLRRTIAGKEFTLGKLLLGTDTSVAYGDAGTIALVRHGRDNGEKRAPEILDTGTLADIVDARQNAGRFGFVTADGQLLFLSQGKLERQQLPYRVQPVRFAWVGQQTLAVVDNRGRILMSRDQGRGWNKYEGAIQPVPSNDIGLTATADGVYVYRSDRDVPSSIIYRALGQPGHQEIHAPTERGGIPPGAASRLTATPYGLYLTYGRHHEFHARAAGQSTWELRSKPSPQCGQLVFDASGRRLSTVCEKVAHESTDGGLTWRQKDTGT